MNLRSGLQICRNGKHGRVGQIRLQHQKVEIHSDDGDMAVLSMNEFRREMADGDIRPLVTSQDGTLQPLSANWLEAETVTARTERLKREKILRHLEELRAEGLQIRVALSRVVDFCRVEGLGVAPCERTLRDWRRRAKSHASMLSPGWTRCGNRSQGPDEILLAVMKEIIDAAIVGSDRFTLNEAWRFVQARYDEEWRAQKGTASLPRHSIKKLKSFLKALPWAELLKLRMDSRTVRAITRTAVRVHQTGIFWECVEIDAAVLNIFVRNDAGEEVGRPVLYVAVDTATGYPVGLILTIQKPSALPFVDLLRFMYFPKPPGFDQKYDIKHRIEVFGKPITARVDNGSEFIGDVAVEVVLALHGDSARCKPYTPQEKPFVERFIGILKNYIQTLPGATTSAITEEPRLLRPGEKLLTLEELRGKVYRFAYDRYALQVNDLRSAKCRKAVAPHDIWMEMASTFTQPVPVSSAEFERSLAFKRESRMLAHDGIHFDGWNYHSDELAALGNRHGLVRYEFSYSELDAMTIYVVPPNGGEMVPAFEKILDGSPIDRAMARAVKKRILEEKRSLDRRTFAHTLGELKVLKQLANSSRSRAQQARVDDMLERAAEQVSKTMPRSDAQALGPTEPLALPMFAAHSPPRGRKKGEHR